MKRKPFKLSRLSIQSFVTTIHHPIQLKGGTLCPEQTKPGPGLCITGEECTTRQDETCPHSTGNTDDPTGIFTQAIMGCLSGD